MADLRYLALRGRGWAFVMAVPRTLRGRFRSSEGKPLGKIKIGLGTQSLPEAQARRWPLVNEWKSRFDRARQDAPLSLVEIAEEGAEAHDFLLDQLAADSARGRYDGPPILGDDGEVELTYEEHTIGCHLGVVQEALAEDDWSAVRAEVQAIERRKGVTVEPGSPAYARLANAILTGQARAMVNRLRLLRG